MTDDGALRNLTAGDAAEKLFSHRSRQPGRDLSRIVTTISRRVMGNFLDVFDGRFFEVCGSTRRDTHIPGRSDLDVGLVPRKLDIPVRESALTLGSLCSYLRQVRDELLADANAKKLIATSYGNTVRAVEESLRKADAEIDEHTNLKYDIVTARFRIGNFAFLEVSSGVSVVHRVGVSLYNILYWDNEFESPGQARKVAAHACLLKLVLRESTAGYGYKYGTPSARGFEQLILGHRRADAPIKDAMKALLACSDLEEAQNTMKPYLTLTGARAKLGVSGKPDHRLGNFESPEGWQSIYPIADRIVNDTEDWRAHLQKYGVMV